MRPGSSALGAVGGGRAADRGPARPARLNLDRYPIGALAYLEETGIDTREVRMAGVDFVGNLIDYVYGPEQRTFYDDRFDMFPEDISEAHAGPGPGEPPRSGPSSTGSTSTS